MGDQHCRARPGDLAVKGQRFAWVENVFRPLGVGLMMGCIALSVVDLIHLFAPTWNGTFIVAGSVLAALEAHYSLRMIRTRELRGSDVTRFRAIEFVTLFILLRIGSYIGDSWADAWGDLVLWPLEPQRILDQETLVAIALALISWRVSTQTARDLERIGEPPPYHRDHVPPQESIANRFFYGGFVLLFLTGITRIGIAGLLDLDRPPVPGLVLNVLVYSLLGLAMMGQVHLTRSFRQWETQGTRVAQGLARRWARYSVILVSVAALAAFLLPTGYTVGLLDVVATLVYGLGYLATLFWTLLWLLLSFLLAPFARLFGAESPPPPRALPPLELPESGTSTPDPGGVSPHWFAILRSLGFWTAALAMVFYVIRSYLRDRPELLQALVSLRPFRVVRGFLADLWRRLTGLAETIAERVPRQVSWRRARQKPPDMPFRLFRLGALSPRERILYYYLSILRRAGQLGFPRHRSQTPQEYSQAMKPHLEGAEKEMITLTQSFVEARYSQHAFDRLQDRQVRAGWRRVKAALRALRHKTEIEPRERNSE
jgi:hypothetical protein